MCIMVKLPRQKNFSPHGPDDTGYRQLMCLAQRYSYVLASVVFDPGPLNSEALPVGYCTSLLSIEISLMYLTHHHFDF